MARIVRVKISVPLMSAALFLVSACTNIQPREVALLAPPPVVPRLPASDLAGEHDRASSHRLGEVTVTGAGILGVALSHTYYSRTSPSRLVLKVDLVASGGSTSTRPPLNLALVFDRSGSMAEDGKFEYAMQAAKLVVENLSERDVVSLVIFNDRTVVLSPAGLAVNKEFLDHRLAEFEPEGFTNLSAGMMEAFAQIDSSAEEEQRKQAILLTDGLANRGITDPVKLRRLAASARDRGIRLSTAGCGLEFDEQLLEDLATAGGGRYSYIRSPEQIPATVSAELDGLLEVVAQNVRLDFMTTSSARIDRVYGRLSDKSLPSYALDLGDVRAGEHSSFLMEITPVTHKEGASAGVDVKLTLDNPETGVRELHVLHAEAIFSKDDRDVRRSENRSVVLHAAVLEATETAEEAILALDSERFDQARKLFDELYEQARRHAFDTRDQQLLNQAFLLKHFMSELAAVGESGALHDHDAARERLKKDIKYRRYLLEHHRDSNH